MSESNGEDVPEKTPAFVMLFFSAEVRHQSELAE
jgi:hypothetical protein